MRRTMVSLPAALVAILACTCWAFAQAGGGGGSAAQKPQAKPEKPATLEEMLAKALKDNPDIRVAESKVREAEAELNRVRLQVMQKLVALQHSLKTQRSR